MNNRKAKCPGICRFKSSAEEGIVHPPHSHFHGRKVKKREEKKKGMQPNPSLHEVLGDQRGIGLALAEQAAWR